MPYSRAQRGRPKDKAAAQNALLPWGYDAPAKKTMPLADFINLITEEEDRTTAPHKIKNVLLYWDRGSLTSGDEAKMVELNIDTNQHFAHVIDVQQWFKDRFPKGENGNQKHSLGEAAVMMDIEFTTQDHLNDLPEEKHPYVEAPMKHCAGGDCFITLRVNVEIITRCIREMNAVDGRSRQIRSDYCFVAIDFEGGGRIGQGTTEGGVSRLFSADLEDCPEYYQHKIESRHSIVREMFNDHIGRKAQDGNMAIDNRKKRTYPRNNFHNGPNTTEKMDYWHQKHSSRRPELFEISVDTEVIGMAEMRNWVLQQLPVPLTNCTVNLTTGSNNTADTIIDTSDNVTLATDENVTVTFEIKPVSSGGEGSSIRSQISSAPSNVPSTLSSTSSTTPEPFQQPVTPTASGREIKEPAILACTAQSTSALERGPKGEAPHANHSIKASKTVPPHTKYSMKARKLIPPHRRIYVITEAAQGNGKSTTRATK
ncbi:hypothetical protein D6C78_05336 [Aureobasidium pullulans]|uniref:Uncharacterized protein n=1 Tax=Aureobasidium pullulans TaxID=5580 RepID=A0A4T0BWA7_AURPU|nr:hypothetical protein D6C78_05336 [Aureobasidium pullulans]